MAKMSHRILLSLVFSSPCGLERMRTSIRKRDKLQNRQANGCGGEGQLRVGKEKRDRTSMRSSSSKKCEKKKREILAESDHLQPRQETREGS